MLNSYGSLGDINSPLQGKILNWDEDLIWELNEFPDEYYSEVMDSMYVPVENGIDGKRILDTKKLKYKYAWLDSESAARNKGERKDFIKKMATGIPILDTVTRKCKVEQVSKYIFKILAVMGKSNRQTWWACHVTKCVSNR